MRDNSHKRHLAKTITWRFVGTIDTMVLSWIISGNPILGLKIGVIEIVTKMTLYYFHERIWFNLKIFQSGTSKVRHVLKTITWRFFGTLDTIILSWLITNKVETALALGSLELFTKMILYYFHERAWYKSNYGLSTNR